MANIVDKNEIRLRILDLEELRDKLSADMDTQISRLKRLLPGESPSAHGAELRRWVQANGGWRGFMTKGGRSCRITAILRR